MVLPRGLSCSLAPQLVRARTQKTEQSSVGVLKPQCEHNKKGHNQCCILFYGTPKGIRTPAASVKGMCPRPLDDGSLLSASFIGYAFYLTK